MSTLGHIPSARAIADTCLCLHAQRTARALARRFDAVFRPLGITSGQFSLMVMLSATDSRRMTDIAAFLTMDRTTLTAAIKALERSGFVAVSVDPNDRRSRLVALTAAGNKALERAKPVWRAEHARLEKERPALDAERLRKLLRAAA